MTVVSSPRTPARLCLMRLLLMMTLLVACEHPTPKNSPVPPTVAPMTSPDAAKLDLEIATRLASADVVVRGRLRVGATRDGHIGTIAVDAILKGAISRPT